MHRYDSANKLTTSQAEKEGGKGALLALLLWLRMSAARHLTWNRNYNIKPREISQAQDRLNRSLASIFESAAQGTGVEGRDPIESTMSTRGLVLSIMAAAGRGGSSDVGQKIRDEILAVQSRNDCKGGMMEVRIHTSPDPIEPPSDL